MKTVRAPPPLHCRDARVYGHMTKVMHGENTPPLPFFLEVGLASVDNDTVNQSRSLRELDIQGTVFFSFLFGGRPLLVVELDHLCEGKHLYSAQVKMIVSRSVAREGTQEAVT